MGMKCIKKDNANLFLSNYHLKFWYLKDLKQQKLQLHSSAAFYTPPFYSILLFPK